MDGSTPHGTLYPTYSRIPGHYKLLECVLDSLETCSSLKSHLPIRDIAKGDLNILFFGSFVYNDESGLPTQVSEQRSKNKGFYVGEWIETLIVRDPWRVMSLTSAGEGREFEASI